nr:phage holin family protein [Peribacillus asahii]
MMWVWIVVANLIYLVLNHQGLKVGAIIPNAVAILFILNEVASLGENSAKLGINIPEPVQKALAIFHKSEKGKGSK